MARPSHKGAHPGSFWPEYLLRTSWVVFNFNSQDELDKFADSMKNRPRPTHDFNTPLAVFAAMLAMAKLPSTSIH